MTLSDRQQQQQNGDDDRDELMMLDEPFDVVKATSVDRINKNNNNNLRNNINNSVGGSARDINVDVVYNPDSVDEADVDVVYNNNGDAYVRSSSSNNNNNNENKSRTIPTDELGDLPALTTSTSNDNNGNDNTIGGRVTGGRSTSLRPLSPPSRAGLDDPATYRGTTSSSSSRKQNNNNNNGGGGVASDDDYTTEEDVLSNGYDSYTRSRISHSTLDDDDEDTYGYDDDMMIPMDERRQDSRRRQQQQQRQQSMEDADDEDAQQQEEHLQDEAQLCALSGDDPTAVFCDSTLTAMGEICGLPPSEIERNKRSEAAVAAARRHRALALGERHSLGRAGGVEEQTAIEVEYVEPAYRGHDGSDPMLEPKRKNALLKAMARKAKDDYQQSRPNDPTSSSTAAMISPDDVEDETGEDQPQENVYASFSASEKRKFLKLINGGMSPYDSTRQVIEEREAGEKDKQDASSSDINGSRSLQSAPAEKTSRRRGMSLAFWKRKAKGKGKDKQSRGATPVSPDASNPESKNSSGGNDENDDEAFEKSGINYYDAVRRNRSYDTYDDEEDDDDGDYSRTKGNRSSESRRSGLKFPKLGFSKLSKEKDDMNTLDSDDDDFKLSSTEVPQPTDERGALNPSVEPHLTIPSPTKDTENRTVVSSDDDYAMTGEEELAMIVDSANASGVLRPVAMRSEAPTSTSREIHPTVSDESLLDDDLANPTDVHEEKKLEDEMEEAMAAKLLGKSTASAAVVAAAGVVAARPLPIEEEQIASEMEQYLTAKDSASNRGSRSFDQMSVVSSRSQKTSMTAGTNFTQQSTRSRRPGQAKVRLEREKTTQNNVKQRATGWQESIQAVAAKTGRVWDPEHGWRDYVDPRNQSEDDLGMDYNGRSIDETTLKSYAEGQSVAAESQTGAESLLDASMTSNWEQRRALVLGAAGEDARTAVSTAISNASQTPSKRTRKTASMAVGRQETKPRGWVETMKVATASLATEERKWDPNEGWSGIDDVNGEPQEKDEEDAYMKEVAITAESDTQDFGMIQTDVRHGPADSSSSTPRADTKGSVTQLDAIADNQDSGIQFLSEDEEPVVDEEATTASAVSGRYIQIGDTGSVRSHYRRPSRNQRPAASLSQQEAIPESPRSTREMDIEGSSHTNQSGLTDVKKERVDDEDAGMFPKHKDSRRASGPVDLDDSIHDDDDSDDELNDHEVQNPARDESFGGIGSDFAVPPADFSWDADDATGNPEANRKAVPRLKINIRDSSALPPTAPNSSRSMGPSSEVSFESRGSRSTSSIPKLAAPKRDTSPIRVKKSDPPAPQTTMKNQSMMSDSEATASTVPVGSLDKSTNLLMEPSPESGMQPAADKSLDASGDFGNSFYSEVTDETPLASQNQSNRGKSPRSRAPPPDETSSVKDLHNYWESRSGASDNKPTPSGALPSSEWKSYLVKKVQSEGSSNVGRYKPNRSPSEEEHVERSPVMPSTPPRDPSGQPKVGAFEDISDLSPIRNEESDSEYAPSEASTSIAQGTTFLQRLQACAAPMVTRTTENCGPGAPMAAHLAFLRSNPTVGGTVKQGRAPSGPLCGRQDVIIEEDDDEDDETDEETQTSRRTRDSWSTKRSKQSGSKSKAGSDVSSVISDEQFGAKTAYLEAIAMKAAVSGGSKKKRRSGSEVSAGGSSTKHSAQFQKFLERRSASKDTTSDFSNGQKSSGQRLPANKPPTGREDSVAARAERYAAEKVEEMMEGGNANRPIEEETGAFPTLNRSSSRGRGVSSASQKKDASRIAAEELAAARVDAMMQSLSPQDAEEGEI